MEKGHELYESVVDGDELFLETCRPFDIFILHDSSYAPNICSSIIRVVNVKLQETLGEDEI